MLGLPCCLRRASLVVHRVSRLPSLFVGLIWLASCTSGSSGGGYSGYPSGFVADTTTTTTTADVVADSGFACKPQCVGKECGADGCGGVCGSCPSAAPMCDAGQKCRPVCTSADNTCAGTTLSYCSETGEMATKKCSDPDCVANGYLGPAKCGANPGEAATCLCAGCTANDNACTGASTAVVCDPATSKLKSVTCSFGDVCEGGVCVTPCSDECFGSTCLGGQEVACVKGTDGCYKKLAPKACSGGKVCKIGGSGCSSCVLQTDCSANLVCTSDAGCTSPSGQTYSVTINTVVFPEKDGAGASWDGFGGLPDPQVCVSDGTTFAGCTTTKSDTLTGVFYETIEIKLTSADKFCVHVYDVDALSDDDADGACWTDWLPLVKSGGMGGYLYKELVWIDFSVVPSF